MSGSSRRALLREASLALPWQGVASELAASWHVVALELLSPEATLRALPEQSLAAEAALPRAVPKRRAEFAAGRHAAALALARAGCFEAIGRAASGAPLWPPGFVGSISHGAGLAVALVAPVSAVTGVGIDVERLIPDEQREEIASRILNDEERARLAAALPTSSAAEHLSLGFSAKESLYKCLNPLVDRFFEFDAAHVVDVLPDGASTGSITLALTRPLTAEFPAGFALVGRYAFAPERIETAVWLGPIRGPLAAHGVAGAK